MGESDRYIDYGSKRQRFTLGQSDNALMWLFVFNVVFFLILATIKAAVSVNDHSDAVFYSQVVNWFYLPADLGRLGNRPWTLFTFMFSDIDLFRAISNMLWLWAFGSILQNITGNKKLIPVYLYGGFVAAVFFILASYSIPSNKEIISNSNLLGANAGVMAVAVAATCIAPEYRFFRHIGRGIPIWTLLVVYMIIDLAAVASQPAAVPIAHLGGALAGLLFVVGLNNKIDGSLWMNQVFQWFINLFNPEKHKPKNSIKEKVFYNTGNRAPFQKKANVTEKRVDEILEKISKTGYDHLTKEEKDILKRASES